ncbi:MAG: DNA polymerase III subunit gamma/tau [Phycisphaerales bacterium]
MEELLDTTASSPPANRSYTVLARRYRSTTFDEVVGQESIARTLKNAIARSRTAHAYLFCGTRGVGKTSMARIFAAALNATDDLTEKDAVAQAIMQGNDIDVIEIDAASNTGVDNVRDLISNAGLSPARSPYKVYIIDEVHMLSKAAFNALLKIMEEPPRHVKFILCTTEPHKVLATIRSRCQLFNFRNIPTRRIAEHLKHVLTQESIEAEDAAVHEVARQAQGSMRDALSLLDRLIAAGDGSITLKTLESTLGTPDHTLVARTISAIAAGDAAAALEAAGELLDQGTSIEQALDTLAEHLRTVMVIAACGAESPLIESFGEARELATTAATQIDAEAAVHMIALCEAASRNVRLSSTSRALFDAVVVRLALTERLVSIPEIVRTGKTPPVEALEKKKPQQQQQPPAAAPVAEKQVTEAKPTATRAPLSNRDSQASESPPAPSSSDDIKAAMDDPVIAKAVDLFGGAVVNVHRINQQTPAQGQEGS